jgi:hypothetical protein
MKKIPHIIILIAAIFAASCSTKTPEIANSIPDDAFVVATFHPKKLYDKGQLATFEDVFSKIDNEVILGILKDPSKSGLAMDEYAYVFSYFEDDQIVIGASTIIKDSDQFASMLNELMDLEGENLEIIQSDAYSLFAPENEEGGMMWNEKQLIFLTTPDNDKTTAEWEMALNTLFDLEKEEAVTSIVDFKDFNGKMKDMNVWLTGDQLQKFIENTDVLNGMDIELPMNLYNNYSQMFMDFDEGAMYMHSETHLSDDLTKAAETFMVAKDELNPELLEIAPGNDLIMAMAFSLELDKMVDMMKNFTPPEMDGLSDKVEETTGVPGKEILEALNGDFVMAINGAEEGSALPVEIFIGIGLDDESLQEKLMGTVDKMADVQKEGDFFMINVNGMELYSGIVGGVWVITNAAGYKDAIAGDGLEKTLNDSKFKEYSEGSMGMYLNLDLTTYPAALQAMMASGGAPEMLEMLTESLMYIGVQASNSANDLTLKTAKDDENSLYTILKMMEQAGDK